MDNQHLEAFRTEVNRRFDSVAELISRLVERIDARFDAMDARFEALDRRVDRTGEQLAGINQQLAAVTRWADRTDRNASAVLATQAAQKHAQEILGVALVTYN